MPAKGRAVERIALPAKSLCEFSHWVSWHVTGLADYSSCISVSAA